MIGLINENGTQRRGNSYQERNLPVNKHLYPLESFKFGNCTKYQDSIKCFTSFSHLNPFFRKFEFDIEGLEIHLFHNPNWMPMELFSEVDFTLHSPNELPEASHEHFVTISLEKLYEISYKQIKTELLGDGYNTNCYNYDLDYKHANFNMRSDCIADCYVKKVRKHCKHSDLAQNDQLFRKDFLKLNRNLKINPGDCKLGVKANVDCKNQCRPDCKYSYYLIEKWERRRFPGENILINLRHSRIPDIIIKYLPQLSFISFVCNFGGLIGMWLGLPFLAILNRSLLFFNELLFNRDTYLDNIWKKNTTNVEIDERVNVTFNLSRSTRRNKGRFHDKYQSIKEKLF